jgi:anti-sigma regulatory factor (Ser/Thr protein kinase)
MEPSTEGNQDQVQVALPYDLTAPRQARAAARTALRRWNLAALLDPLLLAVSELVGNAVRHGRAPVGMWLRRAGQGVRVDVHDASPQQPACRPAMADREAEGGRGLSLVRAVARETGVEQIAGDGKVVWADITPPSSRTPTPPA